MESMERFLKKYEPIILIILLLVIGFIYSDAVRWGLPGKWNPDEIATYVYADSSTADLELTNFTYPSLPRYIYREIARAIDLADLSRSDYLVAARLLSVLLAGLSGWLAYGITHLVSQKRWAGILAFLMMASNSLLLTNAHFAHNDLFTVFFTAGVVYLSLRMLQTGRLKYAWMAFLYAGFAAASKYNGGIIVLIPVIVLFFLAFTHLPKKWLSRLFWQIPLGAVLSMAAYVSGNHSVVSNPRVYFDGLLPALWRLANYGRTPDSTVGLFRQAQQLPDAFGLPFSLLLVISLILFTTFLIIDIRKKVTSTSVFGLLLVLVSLVLLWVPILSSYNVQPRYYLPMLPLAASMISIPLVRFQAAFSDNTKLTWIPVVLAGSLVCVFFYGCMCLTSANLLFNRDARFRAGNFIDQLPNGVSLEYTLYSPNINYAERFESVTYYEIRQAKYLNESAPQTSELVGESGIEARKPDVFITSSFATDRFKDAFTCQKHKEECDFFTRLAAGETNYQLVAEFTYHLPGYLPQLSLPFVNPVIRIYERTP